VKQSGGNVWVYSEPNQGATFKIYLPVDESDRPVQDHAQPTRREWSRGTETVLLVEDAPMIRRLAQQVMTKAGYTVFEAADGNQAIAQVDAHSGPIDIVVTDLIMPGLSGVDLAQRLTVLRAGARVLYMSGYTDNAIVRNGLLADGAPFLQKPFTPEELLKKLRDVLDAQQV
jgi:DNA-binding response OmpR family regulator